MNGRLWLVKLLSNCTCVTSLVLLMNSIFHSVFYMIMMSEFNSFDELAHWVHDIGWKKTVPMRLFMGGTWFALLAFASYIVAASGADGWMSYGVGIVALGFATYGYCHYLIATVLQSFYKARYNVARGWRAPNPELAND